MELLRTIQQELKVPKAHKNTFGNYNYRNCEDILEAVKPLLGPAILTLKDEIVLIGDRYYVKAEATITDPSLMESTRITQISVTAYARESDEKKGMDSAQITGAASSYARKYALNGLFLIDDTKDADSDETPRQASKTASATTKPPKATKDTSVELKAAKDRVVALLKLLGKQCKTKKEYEDAVFDLTGMMLSDENLEEINEKLSALEEANSQN